MAWHGGPVHFGHWGLFASFRAMSMHVLVDVWVMIISLYDKVKSCTEICSDLDGTQACPCRQKKFLKDFKHDLF